MPMVAEKGLCLPPPLPATVPATLVLKGPLAYAYLVASSASAQCMPTRHHRSLTYIAGMQHLTAPVCARCAPVHGGYSKRKATSLVAMASSVQPELHAASRQLQTA